MPPRYVNQRRGLQTPGLPRRPAVQALLTARCREDERMPGPQPSVISPALDEPAAPAHATVVPHGVSFREAFWTWARVAALSFGGPAGQIAVMHRIIVDEKKWVGETRFLHALNYCMLLPGPEAQ